MRRIRHGGGHRRNVSAKLELAVTLAPLLHAIWSSQLPQFKPLLLATSHQASQQAYAVVTHTK